MEREGHNSLNMETLQLIKLGAGFEVEEYRNSCYSNSCLEVGDLGGNPSKKSNRNRTFCGRFGRGWAAWKLRREACNSVLVTSSTEWHVVCFSSLIVTVLRKYWAGNIIKEFTLKMVRSLEPVVQPPVRMYGRSDLVFYSNLPEIFASKEVMWVMA